MGFDCNKWALRKVLNGEWNFDGQCSPFQAKLIDGMIKTLEAGGEIEGLNELLLPGNEVKLKDGNMSTELRIFALIRLGVKGSSEIANLLFCTPRTIYNYRSALKAKAKDRESFEDDVRKLCMV